MFWDDRGDLTSFPLGNSLLLLVNCNWATKWHLLSNDNVKNLCKDLVLQWVPTHMILFFFCIPVRDGPMSTQPIPPHLVGIFSIYDRIYKSVMAMTRRSAYPCTDEHIFKGLVFNQIFQNCKNLSGFGKQVSLPWEVCSCQWIYW